MAVVVACALVTTGLVVWRQLVAPSLVAAAAVPKPVIVTQWRDDLSKGVRLGKADAPIQIIEFADFECPFCAEFERRLKPLRMEYPTRLSVTFVHFPLPGHRFAIAAARVSECAGAQGRFEPMHDKLFEQQDEFGLKSWEDFAREAHVPDIPAFDSCMKKTDPVTRILEGTALGRALDVQGTPTVIINGWRLGRPPTAAELEGMAHAILAGRNPVTPNGNFAK